MDNYIQKNSIFSLMVNVKQAMPISLTAFLLSIHTTSASQYCNTFDQAMYDKIEGKIEMFMVQRFNLSSPYTLSPAEENDRIRKLTQSEKEQLEVILVNSLKELKLEYVEKKMIGPLRKEIQEYEALLWPAIKTAMGNTIVDGAQNNLITAIVNSDMTPFGKAGGILTACLVGGIMKTGNELVSNGGGSLESIREKIANIKIQITQLLAGTEEEDTYPLEKMFVSKIWKYRTSYSSLGEKIKAMLVDVRTQSPYHQEARKKWLDYALKVSPLEPKLLLDPQDRVKSLNALRQRFDSDVFFQGFGPTLKSQLWNIIKEIASQSIKPENAGTFLKQSLFFWGDASTGKTEAATKIADFLGLPYYRTTIKSVDDLNTNNLLGTNLMNPSLSTGWLVTALSKSTPEGRFSNGLLIVDDFHHVLFGANNATAQATFLELLDPNTIAFRSPYFDADTPISRLNILVTSNQKIPEPPLAGTDSWQPLRSRFGTGIIGFSFSANERNNILRNHIQSECEHASIPRCIKAHYDLGLHSQYRVNFLVDNYGVTPAILSADNELNQGVVRPITFQPHEDYNVIRVAQRKLSSEIDELRDWLSTQKIFWYTQAQLHELKQPDLSLAEYIKAALSGHGGAAFKLGEKEKAQSNFATSLKWLEKATELGHTEAKYQLAQINLQNNKGPEAINLLKELAAVGHQGSLQTLYSLGENHERIQKSTEAYNLYKFAADNGFSKAYFKLGWLSWQKREQNEAISHLNRAIEIDEEVNACRLLGEIYWLEWCQAS